MSCSILIDFVLFFQQSCFRGYRDFLQYAILSLYIVQIQACVRRHMTLSRVKMLKSEATKERERESAAIAIVSNRLNATLSWFLVYTHKSFYFIAAILLPRSSRISEVLDDQLRRNPCSGIYARPHCPIQAIQASIRGYRSHQYCKYNQTHVHPFKLLLSLLNLRLNLSLHCSNHAFAVSGILYVMS